MGETGQRGPHPILRREIEVRDREPPPLGALRDDVAPRVHDQALAVRRPPLRVSAVLRGGEDEDLDGGFKYGAWTLPYWHDDIGANFGELMQGVDAFLLGRKTYVTHAEAFEPLPPGRDARLL